MDLEVHVVAALQGLKVGSELDYVILPALEGLFMICALLFPDSA